MIALGDPLTGRERRVVAAVAVNKSNAGVAADLGLSLWTVKEHLSQIAVKLGVGDRSGIVGAAIRTRQLDVPVSRPTPPGFDELLFDVLVRIARGLSNAQIAAELHLSVDAVKSRVRRLLAVLGADSRESAVAAGFACGVLRLVPAPRAAEARSEVAA